MLHWKEQKLICGILRRGTYLKRKKECEENWTKMNPDLTPGTIFIQQPILVMIFNFIQKSREGKENVHLCSSSTKWSDCAWRCLSVSGLLIDKWCPIFTRRFKIFILAKVCSDAAEVLKNLTQFSIWKVLLFWYPRVKHYLQVSKESSENALELKAFFGWAHLIFMCSQVDRPLLEGD